MNENFRRGDRGACLDAELACATGSLSSTRASDAQWAWVQLRVFDEAALVAQQQLGNAVAGAHQIAAQVLARANLVAQRLLNRCGS